MSYFFLFLIFLNLIRFCSWWVFIFAHPSQLEWFFMESHISHVFWWISILSQLDENSWIHFSFFLFSFFLVEVFSSLMAFSFSHNLMLSQNLISPWWASFLPSLMGWTIPFLWWTLFPTLDELFTFSFFWTGLIVFIEDLTKWCWIHRVNTSSSWDLSMHT